MQRIRHVHARLKGLEGEDLRLKRRTAIWIAVAVCVVGLAVWGIWSLVSSMGGNQIVIGFIYDNDEDTPYSRNFRLAQEAVEKEFQGKVKVMAFQNVLEDELAGPMDELAENGASIVFTNNYGNMREQAKRYPYIEVCQVSNDPYPDEEALPNYHTFKGEAYQCRYVSGVVAGTKIQEMIDKGLITPEEAKVGFIAAYPYAEVISGYTAFLLGVRSVVPSATMEVVYIYSWDNYVLEKDCAKLLLDDGCQVISQHTDTVGPAVACEEYYARDVYHIGYNESMSDEAPNTSLASARICWEPYVTEAVRARLDGKPIEEGVNGSLHPKNDMSAGYEYGGVELLELNESLLPDGALERIEAAEEELRAGTKVVFIGDYVGVNPNDPSDVVDLSKGFRENEHSSIPSFNYVLRDVITVIPDEVVGIHG